LAQIEIYEFLKKQRNCKNERYYSTNEIIKALKDEGLKLSKNNIYGALFQLEAYNYLEVKKEGTLRDRHRVFRIKND